MYKVQVKNEDGTWSQCFIPFANSTEPAVYANRPSAERYRDELEDIFGHRGVEYRIVGPR